MESEYKGSETAVGEQSLPSKNDATNQPEQFTNQEGPPTHTRRRSGPRTKQGKEKSRYNAVKHGLVARGLTELDDSDAYESLVQRLTEAYRPFGDLEKFFVQRIAFHMIRLQRAERLEAEYITGEIHPPVKATTLKDMWEPGVIEPGLPAAIGALS